ncbi:MAG TPA: LysR substrate-binding domain-containing protein [Streptosporangiaceae bacterium]|nr:LysR substrate-binding domain-containing protein [Streptosporangiaceae bacterium]
MSHAEHGRLARQTHQNPSRLAELTEFPVVSMSAGTGVRAVYDQACASAGLRPSIAFQASAPSAVADLAGRGLGIAIFSVTMATFYPDRLIAVPVTGWPHQVCSL